MRNTTGSTFFTLSTTPGTVPGVLRLKWPADFQSVPEDLRRGTQHSRAPFGIYSFTKGKVRMPCLVLTRTEYMPETS